MKISNSFHTRVIVYWSLLLLALSIFVYGDETTQTLEITVISDISETKSSSEKKLVENDTLLNETLCGTLCGTLNETKSLNSTKTDSKIDSKTKSKTISKKSEQLFIDLNKATESEFTQIKGIGPILAGRITLFREVNGNFTKFEELLKVKGIGPKTLEKIEPFLYLE